MIPVQYDTDPNGRKAIRRISRIRYAAISKRIKAAKDERAINQSEVSKRIKDHFGEALPNLPADKEAELLDLLDEWGIAR